MKKSTEFESFRYLLYQAWNAAGQMAHHTSLIETGSNDASTRNAVTAATEDLKSAWLALEASGLMPSLFSSAASESIRQLPNLLSNNQNQINHA